MAIELTEALLDQIDKYLKGTLTETELHNFKKQLDESDALKEEVSLQKQLFDTLGSESWNSIKVDTKNEELSQLKKKLKSTEYQELSKKIRTVENEYLKEVDTPKRKNRSYNGFYFGHRARDCKMFCRFGNQYRHERFW